MFYLGRLADQARLGSCAPRRARQTHTTIVLVERQHQNLNRLQQGLGVAGVVCMSRRACKIWRSIYRSRGLNDSKKLQRSVCTYFYTHKRLLTLRISLWHTYMYGYVCVGCYFIYFTFDRSRQTATTLQSMPCRRRPRTCRRRWRG